MFFGVDLKRLVDGLALMNGAVFVGKAMLPAQKTGKEHGHRQQPYQFLPAHDEHSANAVGKAIFISVASSTSFGSRHLLLLPMMEMFVLIIKRNLGL
jgi:hypothetical protein